MKKEFNTKAIRVTNARGVKNVREFRCYKVIVETRYNYTIKNDVGKRVTISRENAFKVPYTDYITENFSYIINRIFEKDMVKIKQKR